MGLLKIKEQLNGCSFICINDCVNQGRRENLPAQQERAGGRKHLVKSERLQRKTILCIGLILLLFVMLLFGRKKEIPQNFEEEPEHIPVIETLQNIWIMEVYDRKIKVFADGEEKEYAVAETKDEVLPLLQREQVADVELTDGAVSRITVKEEKISGRLLSISDAFWEIEGYGKVAVAEEIKCYRLYGKLEQVPVSDLIIGYTLQDFVLQDGKICACLLTAQENMETIRVLLKTNGFSGTYHEEAVLTADTDFEIYYGTKEAETSRLFEAGESVVIGGDSEYFTAERIYIRPCANTGKVVLQSLKRYQEAPSYRGMIELVKTEKGIVIINELLLEEYLYSVVPSEMPASYPLEALKAQAVCARTYAYRYMLHAGYPAYGAHVDDSTGYQVYNNIAEQERSTTAVKETNGQLLYFGERPAETYYYSTSCGLSNDAGAWKGNNPEDFPYLSAKYIRPGGEAAAIQTEEEFWNYIISCDENSFEKDNPWYRWTYHVEEMDRNQMLEALKERYKANEKLILTQQKDGTYVSRPIEKLGKIKEIQVAVRKPGGSIDELLIVGEKATVKVISEYNVRYVLKDEDSKVIKQDNSSVSAGSLLPSAFFVLETGKEDGYVVGYTLAGGGYGHGVGMSQNGAGAMAEAGFCYEEILMFFYNGTRISGAYGRADDA